MNSTRKKKSDLVVQELRRYGVSAFRSRNGLGMMYGQQMDIHSLHSGRHLPSDGLTATKNEGVGIALDEKAALEKHRKGMGSGELLAGCNGVLGRKVVGRTRCLCQFYVLMLPFQGQHLV